MGAARRTVGKKRKKKIGEQTDKGLGDATDMVKSPSNWFKCQAGGALMPLDQGKMVYYFLFLLVFWGVLFHFALIWTCLFLPPGSVV
jgi:hypothetical protein